MRWGRNLKNNLWMSVLLIFLCGCVYVFSKDKCENEFSNTEKKNKEDWFVYQGEFYAKEGEDVYEKSDFPKEVQLALQEENTQYYLKKEENRLIIEFKYRFLLYDFETGCMEEYRTEYGHLGWQVCQSRIYLIENTGDGKTGLTAYDMVSGNVKEIDIGEYKPRQFHVRSDGAIGMWGENAEGDKEYCFLENMTPIYVTDKDEYFGWTNLCGFTENGIILEREYSTGSLQGTKIYEITKEGEIDILAGISDWDNLKAIPEGNLIFEDSRIVAVDTMSGLVKVYDYDFSSLGELQWDIEISEDMEFAGYWVQGDGIWSIWKLTDENVYKTGVLM